MRAERARRASPTRRSAAATCGLRSPPARPPPSPRWAARPRRPRGSGGALRRDRARSASARTRRSRSPSVSISATSTPSTEVPLIRPSARIRHIGSVDMPPASCYTRGPSRTNHAGRRHGGLQVGLHARSCTSAAWCISARDAARLDELLSTRRPHGLYRLRLHRRLAACRHPHADHDAALVAEDRPQADRADGRRHHQGRRSVGPRRDAPAPDRRGRSTRNMAGIRRVLRKYLDIRRRPDRRA